MLTRGADDNLHGNVGKHVESSAPGGPRDLSKDVARQWKGNDARPTVPGGVPETVGKTPGDPSIAPSRQMTGDPMTAAEPAAYSVGNSYHAGTRANY